MSLRIAWEQIKWLTLEKANGAENDCYLSTSTQKAKNIGYDLLSSILERSTLLISGPIISFAANWPCHLNMWAKLFDMILLQNLDFHMGLLTGMCSVALGSLEGGRQFKDSMSTWNSLINLKKDNLSPLQTLPNTFNMPTIPQVTRS